MINKKPIQEVIIDMVECVWYNDNLIKFELIKKSFNICFVSNGLDGSEDNKFKGPDEVKEMILIKLKMIQLSGMIKIYI